MSVYNYSFIFTLPIKKLSHCFHHIKYFCVSNPYISKMIFIYLKFKLPIQKTLKHDIMNKN